MSAIGIDFGTSFCSASWINPATNRPEAILFNENGNVKMPSLVFLTDQGEPLVGQSAFRQVEDSSGMSEDDRNRILSSTIFSIKRKIKRNGRICHTATKHFTHTNIITFILRKIKDEACRSCLFNDELTDVTITYPVVFEEWKKDMLREAALDAGFKNVKLLEEPISAAIGFSESNRLNCKGVLVYDFGGGTFDVAYVKQEDDGTYRIPISPLGDSQCGGDDIDLLMYQEWDKLAWQTHQRHLTMQANEVDLAFVLQCRKDKELLSGVLQYKFGQILPPPGFIRLYMEIERAKFNEIIKPIVEKTIQKTGQLLDEIKRNGYPLDCAILIGGSSRIPLVKEMLREILPVEPQTTGIVDTAVALGASYFNQGLVLKKGTTCQTVSKELSSTIGSLELSLLRKQDTCYCIKCGKQLDTSYKFCIYCGTSNFLHKK